MNYQCQNCKNLLSYNDYLLHKQYCHLSPVNQIATQPYKTTIGTNNTMNYLKSYNNISNNNNIIYPISNSRTNNVTNGTVYLNPNNNRIINGNNHYVYTSNNNTIAKGNVIPQAQPMIQTQNQYVRPQTTVYYKTRPNLNNYPQNAQIIKNKTKNYKCNICGEVMPETSKNDHLLCHKLEQEDKDLLQARRLQDEDLFNNLSPEQIEQQRKIEEYIRRQRQRQNNNNLVNNNDFNIDDDMNMPNMGNIMGNIGGMNTNGIPNIIIRRITNNNGTNNIQELSSGMGGSSEFFDNFFNGTGMMNMGMGNNLGSNNTRRFIIPMGLMGMRGMGGNENDLNEMIERMLHHTRENPTDAAIVSELPETKIDDIKKLDNDKKNCVICMEDFKNGDKTTNLPCLHMFHTNCIQSWLKTQNTCPICKFKLTVDNINNINRRG
jgi:hypothetical protein